MRNLGLGRSARARLWLNEELPARFQFDCAHAETLVSTTPRAADRCVALELLIGRGGSRDYGLLGGSLAGNSTEETELTVGVVPYIWGKPDQLSPFDTPLTYPNDPALIGLPSEFAKAALEGALACPCPPGTVRFDCGAFTAVDSNTWMFRYLGSAIGRLLVLEDLSEPYLFDVITAFRSVNASNSESL